MGNDFAVFWNVGQAILHGQPPYAVPLSWYPLPLAYLFAVFALFPPGPAFLLFLALQLALLIAVFRRQAPFWALYFPLLQVLGMGQLDFLFWCADHAIELAESRRTWLGPALAALITLKPQVALIFLPYHLLRWNKKERLRFVLFTALLWGLPLLWSPTWITDWLTAVRQAPAGMTWLTPGLWQYGWPLPLSVAFAGMLVIWGLRQRKEVQRACLLLSSPIGLTYGLTALVDCAPVYLLAPIAAVAGIAGLRWQTLALFPVVGVAVIGWHVYQDRRVIRAEQRRRRLQSVP